jgi:hypothetical protein
MKLEQQVTSLELNNKLKELGVKQESLYYWWIPLQEKEYMRINKSIPIGGIGKPHLNTWNVSKDLKKFGDKYSEGVSAFTVAELGEMLPFGFASHKRHDDIWWCFNNRRNWDLVKESFHADTEADARAKMLIYLIENKLI